MGNGSVHMGHGQMVDIIDHGSGRWELAFSEAGKPDYRAPPLAEINVEAIHASGAVHPLTVTAGERPSTVNASGPTEGAHRARIMVLHGNHFHTRETAVPGGGEVAMRPGPNGGSMVSLDNGGEVEVSRAGESRWLLAFCKHGSPEKAPPVDDVVAEAIGPRAEDYQVRQLMVLPGPDEFTLAASGRVGDATQVRLEVKRGHEVLKRSAAVA